MSGTLLPTARAMMGAPAYTLGIEEEFQLVDRATGQIAGRAPEVLAGDVAGMAKQEFQRTMVEAATPVCPGARAAADAARERRAHIAGLAAARGLAIAAAGLHPMEPAPASQISDEPRYWHLAARGGVVARELHVFGMHVHVAVPHGDAGVRAMAGVAPHVPGLLALTASSPYHRGQDTSFASFRTILRDAFPRVGPPLALSGMAEYQRLVRALGGDGGGRVLAWDVLPREEHTTLEFRFFDVCPWLDTIELVAACARALTRLYVDRPPPPPAPVEFQLLKENRWRAARYGLDAQLIEIAPDLGREAPARDVVRRLLDRLTPLVEELGDGASLRFADAVLARDTAAAGMRAAHAERGGLPGVVRWVVEQTSVGQP